MKNLFLFLIFFISLHAIAERNNSVKVGRQVSSIADSLNYVDVKTFGATGNGVTNDLAAIRLAVENACTKGLNLYFSPGTYNLGNIDKGRYAFLIHDVNGMTISGNKATLICNSLGMGNNGTDPGRIFQIVNSHNLTFNGLQFFDNGYLNNLTGSEYKGAYGIYIPANSGDVTNISITNVQAKSMLGLIFRDYSTSRFENIDIRNTLVERSYYGIILNNPKNLHTSTYRTDSVKRALFLSGGEFINADIYSINHQAASAEVLLKCYGIPLKNVRINYRSDSSKSTGNAFVSLEQQGAQAANNVFLIENVDINVDCSGSSVGYPVAIRSYDGNNNLETRTPKHWNNIRIRGLSAGVPGRQVQVFSTQDSLGLIEVDQQLDPNNFLAPYFPGFVRKIGNSWNYVVPGGLDTTSQYIDLSKFPGFPGKVGTVKVRATMIDNTSNGTSTNITYQEDVLFIAVASNGNVNIISQSNLQKKSTAFAATATYSTSGSKIKVTFSNYSNILSLAYLTVEPF